MDGLNKRIFIVGVVLSAFGVGINFAPRPKQIERTAEEIRDIAPGKARWILTNGG